MKCLRCQHENPPQSRFCFECGAPLAPHTRVTRAGAMTASALRHKHVQLDQRKLDRARRALGARTETETLDRALDLVVTEADIDRALRAGRRKGKFRRVF